MNTASYPPAALVRFPAPDARFGGDVLMRFDLAAGPLRFRLSLSEFRQLIEFGTDALRDYDARAAQLPISSGSPSVDVSTSVGQ